MKQKNNLLLYTDLLDRCKNLTDAQFGQLIRFLLDYVVTKIKPIITDPVVSLSFDFYKVTEDENNLKWERKVFNSIENGKKGGRPVTHPNPKNPVGYLQTQANLTEPKKGDTVTVTNKEIYNTSESSQCDTNVQTSDKYSEVPSSDCLSNVNIGIKSSSNPIGIEEFELLWSQYPKKDGKKGAFSAFRGSVKTKDQLEAIKGALVNYLTHIRENNTKPMYIKNGSTWFNNWEDWTTPKPGFKPATNSVLGIKTLIGQRGEL